MVLYFYLVWFHICFNAANSQLKYILIAFKATDFRELFFYLCETTDILDCPLIILYISGLEKNKLSTPFLNFWILITYVIGLYSVLLSMNPALMLMNSFFIGIS